MRWREVHETSRPHVDLAKVLEHYGVEHRPIERNQAIQCPFHVDRDPSFSLDIGKGVFFCHSCGEGGDGIKFIQIKEACDYRRAAEIAAALGIATSGDGERDELVRGSAFGGRRTTRRPVAKGPRPGSGNGRWTPSWGSRE